MQTQLWSRLWLMRMSPIRTPTACCVIVFVLRIPGMRRGMASSHTWLPNVTPMGVMRYAVWCPFCVGGAA